MSGEGLLRRIDRLIVKPHEIWIVDYKSSREGMGNFLKQIKEYLAIVGEIHPDKKVRGFLLFLDTARFEEVI